LRQHSETISSLQHQLEAAMQAAADVQIQRQLEVQQAANRSAALELQLEQLKVELSRRPDAMYHQVRMMVATIITSVTQNYDDVFGIQYELFQIGILSRLE
jgi:hypothetical protein